MKRYQKFIIPLIFVNALILSGCEINRSGDGGAIGPVTEATQVQVQPPAPTEPAPGPTVPPDISTEVFPAPEAPPANEVEPGKVLVKLSPQAAVQARIAELGADNVPETQVSTLDQVLREIGASDLEPVIEPVSEATGEDLDSFSAQAEQVGQLFSVSFSPGNDPQAVADRLAQDPAVEFAEPN